MEDIGSERGEGDSSNPFVTVDGSQGEGGGEILRNSLAYSALLSKPISIVKVRDGRSEPGLKPQHLHSLQLVADLCRASMEGNSISSRYIKFEPSTLAPGSFVADTKTAGSITLLAQASLPVAIFTDGPCSITLKGGTNVAFAPQIEFLKWVLRPSLKLFGVDFTIEIKQRGYYPKGRGEVLLLTKPVEKLASVSFVDPGTMKSVYGKCFVAGSTPFRIASDMQKVVLEILKSNPITSQLRMNIETVKEKNAFGNGSGIQLIAETSNGFFLSGSALGGRNLASRDVAATAVNELLSSLSEPSCVDKYLQDQLIIYMALAEGESRILTCKPTLHTQTAINIAKELTGAQFKIESQTDFLHIIKCTGIGLKHTKQIIC